MDNLETVLSKALEEKMTITLTPYSEGILLALEKCRCHPSSGICTPSVILQETYPSLDQCVSAIQGVLLNEK